MFSRGLIVLAALLAMTWHRSCAAEPASLPPEIARHVPSNLETYFVAFLVNASEPKPMSTELFIRHQAYIRKQFEAGVYHVAGPLTDGGSTRGLTILSATSLEKARAIVEADPVIQEHVLAAEVHPAMFPSLSGLKVQYPARP